MLEMAGRLEGPDVGIMKKLNLMRAQGQPIPKALLEFASPRRERPTQSSPMPATDRAIVEQFPGDEWAELRGVIRGRAARGVSPLRIGFPTDLYREIKDRLRPIEAAMEADGLFPVPLFNQSDIERCRVHQEKLATLCRSLGMGDDDPVPGLPPEITVAALLVREYPTLRIDVEEAWHRLGGRIDASGCWVLPRPGATVGPRRRPRTSALPSRPAAATTGRITAPAAKRQGSLFE
jgi:hypothetical protein